MKNVQASEALVADQSSVAVIDAAPVSESALPTATAVDPPCVVCIDDDPIVMFALKTKLEQQGLSVVSANAGMEGYLDAVLFPASAIILDYCLPNGRGDYILRRLKENPATKHIPVIVLTGISDASVKRRMQNLGAESYFTKPIPFPELLDEVLRHVSRRDSMPKPHHGATSSPALKEQQSVQSAVEQLVRDYAPPPGARHRGAVRESFFAPVSIGFLGETFPKLTAFAHDISATGLGLLHVVPVLPGEVSLTFSRSLGGSLSMRLRMIWCQPFAPGWYRSGGQFLRVIQANAL